MSKVAKLGKCSAEAVEKVNSYHSKLKSFLNSFNGVSSKYLNNYLTWNNTVEHRPGSLAEKARNC